MQAMFLIVCDTHKLNMLVCKVCIHKGKDNNGVPMGHQKYYAKLAKRYYVTFQILERINETAYRLKLPESWQIHNAFHVGLLKPYKGQPPTGPIQEDPPTFEEGEEILQPESIL